MMRAINLPNLGSFTKVVCDVLCMYCKQVTSKDGYQFYTTDLVLNAKLYRLIWVIPPDESYIGVRNAYRRSK